MNKLLYFLIIVFLVPSFSMNMESDEKASIRRAFIDEPEHEIAEALSNIQEETRDIRDDISRLETQLESAFTEEERGRAIEQLRASQYKLQYNIDHQNVLIKLLLPESKKPRKKVIGKIKHGR